MNEESQDNFNTEDAINDNSEYLIPYPPSSNNVYTNIEHVEPLIHQGPGIPTKSLLFNSCSATSLITNLFLLQNIHTIPSKMHAHCIAG